jgi:hypothetical protein
MAEGEWQLSGDQRADTVERIKANLASMHFFYEENAMPTEANLGMIAMVIEKKAYTVARVEAKTTTGTRPHHETLKVCCS